MERRVFREDSLVAVEFEFLPSSENLDAEGPSSEAHRHNTSTEPTIALVPNEDAVMTWDLRNFTGRIVARRLDQIPAVSAQIAPDDSMEDEFTDARSGDEQGSIYASTLLGPGTQGMVESTPNEDTATPELMPSLPLPDSSEVEVREEASAETPELGLQEVGPVDIETPAETNEQRRDQGEEEVPVASRSGGPTLRQFVTLVSELSNGSTTNAGPDPNRTLAVESHAGTLPADDTPVQLEVVGDISTPGIHGDRPTEEEATALTTEQIRASNGDTFEQGQQSTPRQSALERYGPLVRSTCVRPLSQQDMEVSSNSGGRKSHMSSLVSRLTTAGSSITGSEPNSVTFEDGESDNKNNKFMAKLKGANVTKAIKTGFKIPTPKLDGKGDGSKSDGDDSKKPRWSVLLKVANFERRIPSHVRARRARRSSSDSMHTEPPATRLHELCATEEVLLEDLTSTLLEDPRAACIMDHRDRFPLHVLGDNDGLLSTHLGRITATTFASQLMKANPDAIVALDADGCAPFVSLIKDWEMYVYDTHDKKTKSNASATNRFMDRVTTVVTDARSAAETRSVDEMAPEGASAALAKSSRHFPRVEIWEEVECCFDLMSLAMDELGGKNGGLHRTSRRSIGSPNQKDATARSTLAAHIAETMPTILKTILLLEGDGGNTRRRLLETSVIRRVVLCPESVGSWLTSMLRKKGIPARRAIDYLSLASHATAEDYVGGFRSILPEDTAAFQDSKQGVFDAVEDLDGTAASLIVLSEAQTERAASTPVLQHIINRNLARPFVVSLVLIDLVLHITLMLAFRSDVSVVGSDSAIGAVPTQVVYFICFHYIIRKGCEAFAMFTISLQVFRGYIFELWNLFDIVAIICTLVALSWRDANPGRYRQGLNAFVVGLLWMKVLAFLKVVNKQMSTFILALIQILRDLVFFAVVLVVIIFMFADMMRIAITTKDDGQFCQIKENETGELAGPLADFCSGDPAASYLRLYAVLIGDFELDDWRETSGMIILFVIFTVIGVIILLNVLIAIISDSYEKAKIQSSLLFGRARVAFVAQNQALESFLKPGSNPAEDLKVKSPTKALATGYRVFRWFVLISLIVTAMSAQVFLWQQGIETIRYATNIVNLILMIIMIIVLTAAIWVLIVFAVGDLVRAALRGFGHRVLDAIDAATGFLVKHTARYLFGLTRTVKTASSLEEGEEEEEWVGRLVYMERAFEKQIGKARDDVKDEIMALERRLYEHEDLVRQAKTSSALPESPHDTLPTSKTF